MNECKICFNYDPEISFDCDHTYCTNCIEDYISTKVNDLEYEIKCPDYYCNEYIPYNFINDTCSNRIVEKLDRNIVRHTVYDSYNLKFCPKCDTVCEKDYNDTVTCGNCDYVFCYLCGYKKDYDHECNLDLIDDIAEALDVNDDEVKACPKCGIIIHLYEGCHCIKCFNCRYKFCWNCLELDKDIDDRDKHYQKCNNYKGYDGNISPDPSSDNENY